MANSLEEVPFLLRQKSMCSFWKVHFQDKKKIESFFSCSFSAVSFLDKQSSLNHIKMKYVQKDVNNINMKMLS